ncbi:hypothetical protein SLA2020_366930 [Shorea laevis]
METGHLVMLCWSRSSGEDGKAGERRKNPPPRAAKVSEETETTSEEARKTWGRRKNPPPRAAKGRGGGGLILLPRQRRPLGFCVSG